MQDAKEKEVVNEKNGRGLFYAVIAIATFIIMAVGATFAYFTATTTSAGSSVRTGSTTLQLKYISYESGWMNDDLIPANTEVVEYSFESQSDITMQADDKEASDKTYTYKKNALCKDDYGNSICSVYVFQVGNDSNSPQTVSVDVVSQFNQFTSLYAMGYEITLPSDLTTYNSTENNNGVNDPMFRKTIDSDASSEDTNNLINVVDAKGQVLALNTGGSSGYSPIFINRGGVTKTLLKYTDSNNQYSAIDRLLKPTTNNSGDELNTDPDGDSAKTNELRTTRIFDNITLESGSTRTFALVLYVKNLETDQTSTDSEKDFNGMVVISSGDGSTGVSGSISVANSDNLQSKQG